jgi:transketolase
VRGIESLMGQLFGISETDLESARVDDVHSLVKAEAL